MAQETQMGLHINLDGWGGVGWGGVGGGWLVGRVGGSGAVQGDLLSDRMWGQREKPSGLW